VRLRVGIVVAYGVIAGVLMYADAHEYLDTLPMLALLGFGILTGAVAGWPWSLLSLLGPLASLGYLQASGFRELNRDGRSSMSCRMRPPRSSARAPISPPLRSLCGFESCGCRGTSLPNGGPS
jgi:hypothetical protein